VDTRFLDRMTPPTLATLILVTSVPAMSMTVILPSLPGTTEAFDIDHNVMQLAVALYLLVNALLHLVLGPLSDGFGRRAVILGPCGVFIAPTIGCLTAPTAATFLAFRCSG
jgi:DHA1 family bicyclomycin/chloramphenicol resistance-like MFS transporter